MSGFMAGSALYNTIPSSALSHAPRRAALGRALRVENMDAAWRSHNERIRVMIVAGLSGSLTAAGQRLLHTAIRRAHRYDCSPACVWHATVA